jgi:transporter family protein
MTSYFTGILAAFAEPVFHAWANILDNYFSNKIFDRLIPLLFFSNVVGLFILPIIWIFDSPSSVSWNAGVILFVISLTEVAYLYPYYWALRLADTSVVASLFSLGTIVVPFLAFLFVGERLTGWQYLGVFLLTVSSVLLALDIRKMKLNRAFALMLIVSTILATQSVLLKYVYEHGVSWGTSVVWMVLFQLLITGILMCAPQNISAAKDILKKTASVSPLFAGMELLGWCGNLGSSYALYRIPVSIARGISSTQPIFVLLYATLFGRSWSGLFKEYLGKDGATKKIILFVLTIVGIILVTSA